MEKPEWKVYIKEKVKEITGYKPEAVYVEGDIFAAYPIVRALRKKHIPVLTMIEKDGNQMITRIP